MSLSRRGFLGLVGSFIGGLVLLGRDLVRAHSQPFYVSADDAPTGETQGGLAGRAVDILSRLPIRSATVSAVESLSGSIVATASTSTTGGFALSVPDGTYEVRIVSSGYVGMSRVRQRVEGGSAPQVDFEMIPLDVSPEDDERIYDAVVKISESSFEDLALPQYGILSAQMPLAVAVPETIDVLFEDGHRETMPLDQYLRAVVPAEMPSNWHMEALKAQAIAARTYAVAYTQTGNPICTTTFCQVYNPRLINERTDAAVYETHREVAVYNGDDATYKGRIITAWFFSRCNGLTTRHSEEALALDPPPPDRPPTDPRICRLAPWAPRPWARARPCGGHERSDKSDCGYYGHGVGMCQYGVKARADSGWNYRQIITHYYTSVTVEGGIDVPAQLSPTNGRLIESGGSVTLTWGGTGSEYYAELKRPGGMTQSFGWTPGTSWTLEGLTSGPYEWRVKAKTGLNESVYSGYWRFIVADTILKTYFPRMDKMSSQGS